MYTDKYKVEQLGDVAVYRIMVRNKFDLWEETNEPEFKGDTARHDAIKRCQELNLRNDDQWEDLK